MGNSKWHSQTKNKLSQITKKRAVFGLEYSSTALAFGKFGRTEFSSVIISTGGLFLKERFDIRMNKTQNSSFGMLIKKIWDEVTPNGSLVRESPPKWPKHSG